MSLGLGTMTILKRGQEEAAAILRTRVSPISTQRMSMQTEPSNRLSVKPSRKRIVVDCFLPQKVAIE